MDVVPNQRAESWQAEPMEVSPDPVEEASLESFPASDAPAWAMGAPKANSAAPISRVRNDTNPCGA
jgi:hypothetical protein